MVFFRRFNQTVDHAAGLCAAWRVGEEPVFAAHDKGLYAAFSPVVAQFQTAVLQLAARLRPLLHQAMDGPAHRGCRRRFRLHLICP